MLEPPGDERQLWLATLTSLLAIRDSADQLAGSAALSAAQHGADYPAIGDAAGMTRQGARRKWPGLAGLSDARQRKLAWWRRRGEQFAEGVRVVLATSEESPRLAVLRDRLAELTVNSLDLALVDAHTVAVGEPTPTDAEAAHARGLLAALTADAAMNSPLVTRLVCGSCPAMSVVDLWGTDLGDHPVPACREHAIEALGRPTTRIVAAHQPDVALAVFAEASDRWFRR